MPDARVVGISSIMQRRMWWSLTSSATSTIITAALYHGVEKMIPVETVQEAEAYLSKGYPVAGERDGYKIEHFQFGNSPYEFMGDDVKGKTIIHKTNQRYPLCTMSKVPETSLPVPF